jgi:hypothetical protein
MSEEQPSKKRKYLMRTIYSDRSFLVTSFKYLRKLFQAFKDLPLDQLRDRVITNLINCLIILKEYLPVAYELMINPDLGKITAKLIEQHLNMLDEYKDFPRLVLLRCIPLILLTLDENPDIYIISHCHFFKDPFTHVVYLESMSKKENVFSVEVVKQDERACIHNCTTQDIMLRVPTSKRYELLKGESNALIREEENDNEEDSEYYEVDSNCVLQLEEDLLHNLLTLHKKDDGDYTVDEYGHKFQTIICSEILKLPVAKYNSHLDKAAFTTKDRNDIKPIIKNN